MMRRYNRGVDARIKVTYKDGVFEPLRLKAAELRVECWNNPADAADVTP